MSKRAWIVVGLVWVVVGGDGAAKPAAPAAMDWAFRFASAIRSDANDRGRAQAEVVSTALKAGHLDLARAWADEVTGWRRGVVYAELAVSLAKRGREAEARALLAQAEEMSRRIEDWSGPRVAAHVAAAYAALGDRERSVQISAQLEGEEKLKALPVVVAPLIERGEFEAAMEFLGRVTDAHTFDLRRAQLRAYMELAQHPALGMQLSRRKQAVAAAIAAARELPVTIQAETTVEAADLLRGWGSRAEAVRLLEEIEAVLIKARNNALLRAPIVVQVALAWERCGERARCRRLLQEALAGVEAAQDIDQPMVYAAVAGGYAAVRAERQARQMWASGMDLAAALVNARPRALAIVELCRAVGAHGLALDAAQQARLRSLYDGLGAPW